ncbi:MAG: hypothetical protein QM660_10960 [Dysgonomonas sp.]
MKSRLHNHPKIEEKLRLSGYITDKDVVIDPEFDYLFEKSKQIWTSLHKGTLYVVDKDEYFDVLFGTKKNKQSDLLELI